MADGGPAGGPRAARSTSAAGPAVAELADAFGAYGDLVYEQVGWRLRAAGSVPTPNEVADLVRDTFMIAHVAPTRPPAGLLRAWLLAIARNECLRALELPGRTPWAAAAPPPHATDLGDAGPAGGRPVGHPGGGLPAKDLRALVRWAAEGLDRREREILDLGLRHGLSAAEIARVLGIEPDVAGWALNELNGQFTRVLGTLVLARSSVGSCVRLMDMARRWDGVPGEDRRRRFLRHTDACDTCGLERTRSVDAVGILRMPPLVRAPRAIERWVLADATDNGMAAERVALADRAGPFGADGFPVPLDAATAMRRPSALARPGRQRLSLPSLVSAARPASRRATGTRNGEQDT